MNGSEIRSMYSTQARRWGVAMASALLFATVGCDKDTTDPDPVKGGSDAGRTDAGRVDGGGTALDAAGERAVSAGEKAQATISSALSALEQAVDLEAVTAQVQTTAAAIKTRLASTTCAVTTTTANSITVDFGALGCTLTMGTDKVGGAFTLSVTEAGTMKTIAVTFDGLTVNGKEFGGSLSLKADSATPNAFEVTATDLTNGTMHITGTLMVTFGANAVTLNSGEIVVTDGATTTYTVKFNGVGYTFGQCCSGTGNIEISNDIDKTGTTPECTEVTVTFPGTCSVSVKFAVVQVGLMGKPLACDKYVTETMTKTFDQAAEQCAK